MADRPSGRRKGNGHQNGHQYGHQNGHQPGPGPASDRTAQVPFLFVLAGSAAGLGTIGLGAGYARGGTLVLSGVLLVAATARLVLPDRRAGMLASRRRSLDVAIFAVLGCGLLAAGLLASAAA